MSNYRYFPHLSYIAMCEVNGDDLGWRTMTDAQKDLHDVLFEAARYVLHVQGLNYLRHRHDRVLMKWKRVAGSSGPCWFYASYPCGCERCG